MITKFVLLVYCVTFVRTQAFVPSDLRCTGEVSCTSCVAAGPTCAWCKQWEFTGPRCDVPEVLRAAGCPEEHVYLRGSSRLVVDKNVDFSDHGIDEAAKQVKPQSARVTLRAGERGMNLTFKFRPAKNYPLDVYYLMDLTWSMKDDKETLANLGGDIAKTLGNLTENFRLGFGSYVDKPTMPFVDQAQLSNPCRVERQTCAPAYGYRNHLSLNRDTTQFADRVREAPVSGNLDNAEGGLDALLQALVCKDNIGWAKHSRKIVLLASDGILHFAGDGKLGGAVRNNDGKCHLDPDTGLYTMSTLQDYPSLGQIDALLLSNKVNVIFAVTQMEHYLRLSNVLQGSTFVAILEDDSSNIIQLVRQGYQDIASSVTFSDNSTWPLRMSYTTSCGGRRLTRENSTCENVEEGEEYEFTMHFYLESCPAQPELWHQRVAVEEKGIVAGLSLDVDLLCGCDCESKVNSELCFGHGDLECGICICHEGWFGPSCRCTGRNATTVPELNDGCLPPEAALSGIDMCWGRGDCVCGQCECYGDAHGRFCECDDSRCDRWGMDGARCGGAGHGRCACGRCECEPGWEGASCSCTTDKKACIAPGDTKPCSGQGECVCGQCICGASDDNGRFTGRYCEKCDTCKGLCELYRPCVLCKAFSHSCPASGLDPCHTNSSDAYLDLVSELHVLEEDDEQLCVFTDTDNCIFKFAYRLDKHRKVRLKVLQSRTCETPVNKAAMAGLIIAILVFVLGIVLLLLCRVAVAAKDRIEYQRFLAANEQAKFQQVENPIYKPAVTHYTVPQGYMGPVEPSSPTLITPLESPPPMTPALSPSSQ